MLPKMDDGASPTRTAADELALEQGRASMALDAAHMGEFDWDILGDRLNISDRMSAIIGRDLEAPRMRTGATIFSGVHPDDAERLRIAVESGLRASEPFEVEFRRTRRDSGALQWIAANLITLHDASGQPTRMIGVIRDITQERARNQERSLDQERVSLALAAAGMGEFEWDMAANTAVISPRMAAIFGRAPDMPAEVGADIILSRVHPDDSRAVRAGIAEGLRHERPFEIQARRFRPDNGEIQWISAHILAQRDGPGPATRLIGVVQDITARKREESAREALVAELDHRVKNVLASVQSLAAQSARKTTSVDAFLKTFAGRLAAMASAHTLLTATRWRGAEISQIAAAELGGLAPGQARWSGPEIVLNPRATNALTLALHELATNALKYGALATERGRIEVKWTARPDGGFELVWSERDGPPVTQPDRRGFGSTLLERVTGRELGGEALLEFRPAGVRAVIRSDATALARDRVGTPAPAAAKPAAATPTHDGASAGQASAASVKGRRILIVEDAVLLALELEAALTEAGASVVGVAADVQEGLRLAQTPFDVAVLDANLNGQSVAPVAQALAAAGKPFIIATGYGDAGLEPEGFDVPVVRKPYNVNQIAAAVAQALSRK